MSNMHLQYLVRNSSMTTNTVLYAVLLSSLSCLAAVLIERLLVASGCTRGHTLVVVILTFTGSFFGHLLGYKLSFYVYEIAVIFIGIVAANRFDFITTAKEGRWWWRKL
jgi:hypothetical protein